MSAVEWAEAWPWLLAELGALIVVAVASRIYYGRRQR